MTRQMDSEFRNKIYLMEELFQIYPNPEGSVLVRDCFLIKEKKAKYYNQSNNNMQPTRFDFALVPKYDLWADGPDNLNIMLFQQIMKYLEIMINFAIEDYLSAVAVSSHFTTPDIFEQIKIQASVSLIDPDKLDTIHMANMYRQHFQNK